MVDPVRELKTRAELLHHRVAQGDEQARARLRALPELKKADDEALTSAAARLQRKHYLAVVAREHGFSSWEQARRVLEGSPEEADFGTMLYASNAGAINVWFADHVEARKHLDEVNARGDRHYLLAWRKQFLVCDRYFIEALGLDPDDADWAAIGCDWARPGDPEARRRLYQKRLEALRDTPVGAVAPGTR
jgi:hypothetical protein